jgi:hypothetical protein
MRGQNLDKVSQQFQRVMSKKAHKSKKQEGESPSRGLRTFWALPFFEF